MVTFSVTVHNVGDEPATAWVTLIIDDRPPYVWTATIAPDDSKTAIWHVWFMAAGTYTVTIDDLDPQTIVVGAD